MSDYRPTYVKLAAVAAIATLSCLSGAYGEPLVADSELQAAGLTRYWEANIPLSRGDALDEGFLVDDTLYVTTTNGTIFTVKVDVGLIRWAEKLTAAEFRIHRPSHFEFGDGRKLTAILTTDALTMFDHATGDLVRRLKPDFPMDNPPVGVGRTLYAGSPNGRAYSMVISSGCSTGLLKQWEVLLGTAITARPVLYGAGRLLLATHGGDVVSCNAANKQFLWNFRASGAIEGDPVVSGGDVYAASLDRSLYKLDGDSGALIWRHRFPCRLVSGPVVIGRTVYQWCDGHGLTALDATGGTAKWNLPDGADFLARMGTQDAVLSSGRQLMFVEADSGEVITRIDAPNLAGAVTNPDTQALFLVARDGRVLCARPADVPFLRHQRVSAERARLHLPADAGKARTGRKSAGESGPATGTESDPFRSRRDTQP